MTNRTSRSSAHSREIAASPHGGGGGSAPIWTDTQAGMTTRRLFRPTEWPMAAKLLATFGLIALAPLLIVGFYSYGVARETVLAVQEHALVTQADDLAARLDSLLVERQRDINLIAGSPSVKTFSADWPQVSPDTEEDVQELLRNFVKANPYFHLARLLDREGRVILSTAEEIGADYSFRPYFQQALAGNAYVSDISISVDLGQPVIYFSAPVRDDAGQVVAVAMLRVLAEEIWSLVEAQKDAHGDGSVAILFDEYGIRLAHASDRSLIFKSVVPLDPEVEAQLLAERRFGDVEKIESTNLPDLAEGLRQAGSQPHFTHQLLIRDEPFHTGAAQMTSKPWTVIETVSESAFLATVNRLRWTIGLAGGVVVLLALLLTTLATRWIVKPLGEITAAARRLADGELDRPMASFRVQREDEIGALLESFEAMRMGLQASYAQLETRNRRLRRLYELSVALAGGVTEVSDRMASIAAELLDVKVATVEQIGEGMIAVVSMYDHGQIINGGEFALKGTPCECVCQEKSVCQYTRAAEQFPDDPFLAEHGLTTYLGVPILDSQGEVLGIVNAMDDRERRFDEEDIHLFQTLAKRIGVEMEQARAEAEIRRRQRYLVELAAIGQLLLTADDVLPALPDILARLGEAAGVSRTYVFQNHRNEAGHLLTSQRVEWADGRESAQIDNPELQNFPFEQFPRWIETLGQGKVLAGLVRDSPPEERAVLEPQDILSIMTIPIFAVGEWWGFVGFDDCRTAREWPEVDREMLRTATTLIGQALTRAALFESLANEQHNTELLYHLSMELATNLDPGEVAKRALQAATDALGVSRGNILTVENDSENINLLAVTGYDRETVSDLNQRLNWKTSQGVTGRVVQTRTAAIIPDVSQDPYWVPIRGLDDWVKSIVSVPLVAGNDVVGVLNLLSEQPDFFKVENLSLVTAITSPVALALQNARHYEGMHQRLKELEIIADTSSELRKAQSYNDISPILLAKAVEGLKADAGALLLLENNVLKFTTLFGETSVSTGDTCPPDAGMMWQTLNSGRPLFIPDVTQIEELHKSALCQALMGDALSCACVPLQTTASAIGVVFLNWKKKSFLSAHESRLLESLAEIAANAIYRSSLHMQTVQQAQDLTLAYDATIEGWSRALDLRDKETEDHTLRVTNLILQLAQAIGVSESEFEHIRRGALLHDIGKMGVPDNILHKAGALSDEEWTLMRRHPQLAYDMLSPIAYLQPALEIPFCHHEKWDGTGYPRGLKGEEIPLTARIFAVVDVFDALTSDRPYRPAWTKRKTTAYIRQQAGLHFDPKVVDIFLKMIGKK